MTTTPKQKYKLTEEHRAQLKPWADKWIKIALSTTPMSSDDKLDCVKYVKELYDAADCKAPKHIMFVPSPFALAIAGGFAAAIAANPKASKYTIPEMVKLVIESASTEGVSLNRWYINPYNIPKLNEKLGLGESGLKYIKNVYSMWNGGNQWSGWTSYISFFRYVAKLDIDYSKWNCYEKLTELSGPRVVHTDFCFISDRSTVLTLDAQNRPHSLTGPFTKWSDGSAMYSVANVRIPAFIIEDPKQITVERIEKEENAEIRRIMVTQYGQEKFILDSKSEVVHQDDFGILYRKDMKGDEPLMMVKVVNSTAEPDGSFKDYFLRVDPNIYGGITTAHAGVASTWRKEDGSLVFEKPEDYDPAIET